MGALLAVFRSLENPQTPLSNPDEWLYDALGAGRNSSGERVNAKTALSYSPLWRGLNLIATTFAKTPLILYRPGDVGGKERATGDPRYNRLKHRPCDEYNDYRWKLTMAWRALLRGNSFAYIMRNAGGDVELVPLDPDQTYVFREGAQLYYMTKVGDRDVRLFPEDVIHFVGWGDGPIGLSLVEHASECIGLGLAQQKHASVFYKNGMKPSIVLEYPKMLTQKDYDLLLERWKQAHSGASNMEKPLLLQGEMTAKPWMVSGRDAQFLEQRKFGVREAANFLNLPAYKLGDDAKTSFASLEQSNQEFIDESIDPHFVMAESELREKLLTDDEKTEGWAIEFHRQALMRTNFTDRQNGYRTALGGRPYMIPDEVRALENMPPLPDGVGSQYLDPLNMGNLGGDPTQGDPVAPQPQMKEPDPVDPVEPDADDEGRALRGTMFTVVDATIHRVKTRLEKQAGKRGTVPAESVDAAKGEVRTALTPYCMFCRIDIDGALVRAMEFVQSPTESEFSPETIQEPHHGA